MLDDGTILFFFSKLCIPLFPIHTNWSSLAVHLTFSPPALVSQTGAYGNVDCLHAVSPIWLKGLPFFVCRHSVFFYMLIRFTH